MGLGYRVYLVEGDVVVRIAQRQFDAFFSMGKPVFTEYANRQIDVALAYYSVANRKPQEVVRIETMRMAVDEAGGLDKEHWFKTLRAFAGKAVLPGIATDSEMLSSAVVDSERLFDKRRINASQPKLRKAVHAAILEDLFR